MKIEIKNVKPKSISITQNKDDDTYEVIYSGIVFILEGKEVTGIVKYPRLKLDFLHSGTLPCGVMVKDILRDVNEQLLEIIALEESM